MKLLTRGAAIAAALFLSACATHQDVLLAKSAPPPVVSIAQVPSDGNSEAMDGALRNALVQNGFTVRAPLPAGTRQSSEVDAIVSYVDVWRWDMVMYLHSLAVKIFDARNGDLLVTGDWKNSAFHGFQDENRVISDVVAEMTAKLRTAMPAGASQTTAAAPPADDDLTADPNDAP
ncbi:hypothetical protein [Luteimonas sp. MC1895]|uniref:hypothetical protein n=1 Tax=Luteimonas sp. MC1895 TaxID=2819513 RepID=UPI0018F0D9B5|nr:hypothetical protein [Luteimonas sp. MC1895]MBJ6979447.1 hypothetical protein [Luteimonas sp. MC1895]